MMDAPSQTLRARWLEALLPLVAFDGWTHAAAREAAEMAGLSAEEQAFAAPNGITDLIGAFFDRAEAETHELVAGQDLSSLKVRERVALGITTWLMVLAPHREAVRRAAVRGFLPWGTPAAVERAWSIADMVWSAIGDTSKDYNKYTKRGLLSGVIPPIVLHWLDEEDEAAMAAYIDRQVLRAMQVGQFGAKLLGPILGR